MPRIPREFVIHSGLAFHKIWRGHNKEWNLSSNGEKKAYLRFLNESLDRDSIKLFNLTLMSNHTHESYSTEDIQKFSNFMRRHHMRYGLFFNRKHQRCGKVAHDRPMTATYQDEAHEMDRTFYIHANPVRAGIVKDAKDYAWSTHKLYAFGKREQWMKHIKLPDWYLNLARTPAGRRKKYRELFDAYLREEGLIRKPMTAYGIGDFFWMREQKEKILRKMKDRYGPPG